VRQLLSHTSGLSRHYDLTSVDLASRDAATQRLLGIPACGKPGERVCYANANYFLTAAIVESVAGVPFEEYLRAQLFRPARMTATGFCGDPGLDVKRSATRYENGRRVGTTVGWPYSWGHRGIGYVVSTAEDLWRFSEAIDDGAVLPRDVCKTWFTPVKDHAALGWFVERHAGREVQYHTGMTPGARAYLGRYPATRSVVVVLVNSARDGAAVESQVAKAIEPLLR
jgi:D-alanyl-D-alanine carboxypeptidase